MVKSLGRSRRWESCACPPKCDLFYSDKIVWPTQPPHRVTRRSHLGGAPARNLPVHGSSKKLHHSPKVSLEVYR